MSDVQSLFQPLRIGAGDGPIELGHRIALAPLTRNRASEPNLCPHDLHVEYYAQRASPGGLLITEATCISPEAVGYMSVPGIWTEAQTRSWRDVTNAVHARGGKIFMQLWHTGRIAQPSYGEHPLLRASRKALPSVSASDVCMTHPKTGKPLQTLTYKGPEECAAPRALSTEEVSGRLRNDYVHAARNAMRAGFDGVELHAAHGYLVDQFIQDGTNKRTDQYGGTAENRCRLLFELCDAIVPVVGAGRLAVRLSPTTIDPRTGRQNQLYFATTCSDPDEVYAHAVRGLNRFPLAYLLLTEPRWSGRNDHDVASDKGFTQPLTNTKYRALYSGTLMGAGGFTPSAAARAVAAGHYDLIAFGRWFISNPDLPERIRRGSDLNVYDRDTFYTATIEGGGGDGYIDYPNIDGTVGTLEKYSIMQQSDIGSSLGSSKL